MKRGSAHISTSIVALSLLSGCIFQPEPRIVQGEPYPAPGAKPQEERRDSGSPKVETTPSATTLDVTLSQSTECRDQTPMVRDVLVERKANVMEQYINSGSALGLAGIGTYVMLAPCTTTPSGTSSNPNPPSQPCTADEKDGRTITGGVLIGVGALFGAAFVYNIIRARDSKETVPVREERKWKSCGTRPMANTPVQLELADGQQVPQTTDAQGHARFDLTAVRWTDAALKTGQARITGPDRITPTTVSLSALPQYGEWQRRDNAEREHDRLAHTLQEVEEGLAGLRSAQWTYQQADLFEGVKDKMRRLNGGRDKLTAAEQARATSASTQVDQLASAHAQEIAIAAEQRAAQRAAEAEERRQQAAAQQSKSSCHQACDRGADTRACYNQCVREGGAYGARMTPSECATLCVGACIKLRCQ